MNTHSIAAGNLGYPRIGLHRDLKFALERFWSGECSSQELEAAARDLRAARWRIQAEAGIVHIPSNDFSLYDHVLDAAVLVGAIPARYSPHLEDLDLPTYFAMAHGNKSTPAMKMTKWFDTNYHYIVPEFEPGMEFRLASRKPVEEFLEAKALGFTTRPVLLGPVSLVLLGKAIPGTRISKAFPAIVRISSSLPRNSIRRSGTIRSQPIWRRREHYRPRRQLSTCSPGSAIDASWPRGRSGFRYSGSSGWRTNWAVYSTADGVVSAKDSSSG